MDPQRKSIAEQENYDNLPFLELIKRVLSHHDLKAHAKILTFRYFMGGKLSLSDLVRHFTDELCAHRAPGYDGISQDVYDLTLDRFLWIPLDEVRQNPLVDGERRQVGHDSRHFYRAFLEWVKKHKHRIPRGKVQREAWVCEAFAGFVRQQVLHAFQEAKRKIADRFSSRYNWQVAGRGSITVRLPRTLTGSKRRRWLETHILDVNPSRPGERARIQSIIDRELIFGQEVSLDQTDYYSDLVTQPPNWYLIELDGLRFPEFVAEEKVQSISLQRPSIQRIGSGNLRRIILIIFDNLVSESLTEEALAELVGLTKTAFSHFAGSDWYRNGPDGIIHVPDLWANVMYLLVNHPIFTEAAQELGLLDEARAVLKRVKHIRLGTERP